MPGMSLDTADAIELAELLQFIVGWLAADPATLTASLLAYVGHPAYGPRTLRADLDRFAFLLGGNDGESLFEPGPGPLSGGQTKYARKGQWAGRSGGCLLSSTVRGRLVAVR